MSLIDTDLNLDFAQPLDYIDSPELKKKQSSVKVEKENGEFKAFGGTGSRLDGKAIKLNQMVFFVIIGFKIFRKVKRKIMSGTQRSIGCIMGLDRP